MAPGKRITIFTTGTRGDIQPFIPLAFGLRRAGFAVRLAAGSEFQPLIEGEGIEFAPVELDYNKLLLSPEVQAHMEKGGANLLAAMLRLFPRAFQMVESAMRDAWSAAPGTDAVLYTANGPWGFHIAQALKVPAVCVCFQPLAPSGEVPSAVALAKPSLPVINRLSHLAFMLVTWLPLRSRFNRWRKESLSLAPIGWKPPFPLPEQTVMGAYSPTLSPQPQDWPPNWRVVGHWLSETPPDWRPPADLSAFLEAGPPPIYLGFGSMITKDRARVTQAVLGALERTGGRSVVSRGWNLLEAGSIPANIFLVDQVPHAWLFPRCSMVVHHGGGGTTGAGARSGVPSMAIPYGADQAFWGWRLRALGVGPAPILYRKLTAEKLAAAIRETADNPAMCAAAADAGAKIAAEDGVGGAVEIVRMAIVEGP
ncbi:MAG: glycosyltransferase family 1 protein [Anaerolineales bacterium]|nr:glycosyltransferase family 1 protein [Anaerolineales bacterium]